MVGTEQPRIVSRIVNLLAFRGCLFIERPGGIPTLECGNEGNEGKL
jgi:hypothetical protein